MICKLIIQTSSLENHSEIALKWTAQNIQNIHIEKPTLTQVMAWCRQATSHCLSQCRPRFIRSLVSVAPSLLPDIIHFVKPDTHRRINTR